MVQLLRGDEMKHAFKAGVLQCMHFKHTCLSNAATRKVMDYEFDFCLGCEREMWLDGESSGVLHNKKTGTNSMLRRQARLLHADT